MCGGIAGPPMGNDNTYRYSEPRKPMLRDLYKKETGGMKKRCSCGQINPTNTKCWDCGKPHGNSRT